MKDLLQQEGVTETQSHWKTVTQKTYFSQLETVGFNEDALEHGRTEQSPDEGHEQGMFRNFLEKSGPILL